MMVSLHSTNMNRRGSGFRSVVKHVVWITFLCAGVALTETSYGIVHTQFSIGLGQKAQVHMDESKLIKNFHKKHIYGDIYKLSIHATPPLPIPMLSVGLGLGLGLEIFDLNRHKYDFQIKEDTEKISGQLTKLKSYIIGPEMSLSFAIPGIPISPVARVFYAFSAPKVSGFYKKSSKKKNVTIPLLARGLRTAVGVNITPLPVISFFAEYVWSQDKIELSHSLEAVKGLADTTKYFDLDGYIEIPDLAFKIKRQGFLFGIRAGI